MHLDTNVAIALLNNRQPQVRLRFNETLTAKIPLALSVIVYHELMYGAAASERRIANEEKIAVFIAGGRISLLPFETAEAIEASDIRAHLKRSGSLIGPYDIMIAAQARRAGVVLVTANTREFERVPGLLVADWTV